MVARWLTRISAACMVALFSLAALLGVAGVAQEAGPDHHTWDLVNRVRGVQLIETSWATAQTGWRLEKFGDEGPFRVARTLDGAETWTTQLRLPVAGDIDFVDERQGWVTAIVRRAQATPVVAGTEYATVIGRTEDGGESYDFIEVGAWLQRIDFVNSDVGYALSDAAAVLRTQDGGATWTSVGPSHGPDVTFADVAFADDQTGWVVGYEGDQERPVIYGTHDAGATWVDQTPSSVVNGYAQSVTSVDPQTAWAVINLPEEGSVARTADGGATWTVHSVGRLARLQDVAFIDGEFGRRGWAVGYHERSVNPFPFASVTFDDGLTWETETPAFVNCVFPNTCSALTVEPASDRVYAAGWGTPTGKYLEGFVYVRFPNP